MFTEKELKELTTTLDNKTANIENDMDTQDWASLSVLADLGKENAVKAIEYAYKLGVLKNQKQTS